MSEGTPLLGLLAVIVESLSKPHSRQLVYRHNSKEGLQVQLSHANCLRIQKSSASSGLCQLTTVVAFGHARLL